MKCANCGRKIGIEDKVCPYCNQVNKLAEQHAENSKQYDKRFQKTQGEVLDSAKKMEGLGIRAIILAVLVIGILIMSVVSSLNYADPDTDKIKEADAKKNAVEYAKLMDEYLEQGDYLGFKSFVYSHKISFWDPPYDQFVSVNYCAQNYYECVRHMESIILRSDDPDYHDDLDLNISHVSMYLREFWDVYAVQMKREKNETYRAYIEDMDQDIRAMLRTYLQMSEEEVDAFTDLTEAKMAVRLEEVLKHE